MIILLAKFYAVSYDIFLSIHSMFYIAFMLIVIVFLSKKQM